MALFLKKELDNGATIAVWKITETEDELLKLSSTPTDEMEEISYISNANMRKQRLAVRALLNELFDEKVYLSHHDNGKPYIENNATNISITHTDKYVAIITHDEDDLGIDIESLDRDFTAVEKKALSEDEIDDLEDDAEGENDAMIIGIVACAIIKAYAKAHATSVYDEVVMAILMRWNDHPLFFTMLQGAARKEERRFAEDKRNNLLRYELEQAAVEGEVSVREMVAYAKEMDAESIKVILFMLGKANVDHGNMYDSEYNDLYDVYLKKTQVVYNFKSLNDIHDNQEVKIGK